MAKKKTPRRPDSMKAINSRLNRLEKMLREALSSSKVWKQNQIELRETAVEPWRFLVRRQHPWRKQLYVKGRNLTARQLVGAIKSNQFNEENAAANFHLPIEAIREALAYVEKNSELLQTEAEIERLMRKREGAPRVGQPVS